MSRPFYNDRLFFARYSKLRTSHEVLVFEVIVFKVLGLSFLDIPRNDPNTEMIS